MKKMRAILTLKALSLLFFITVLVSCSSLGDIEAYVYEDSFEIPEPKIIESSSFEEPEFSVETLLATTPKGVTVIKAEISEPSFKEPSSQSEGRFGSKEKGGLRKGLNAPSASLAYGDFKRAETKELRALELNPKPKIFKIQEIQTKNEQALMGEPSFEIVEIVEGVDPELKVVKKEESVEVVETVETVEPEGKAIQQQKEEPLEVVATVEPEITTTQQEELFSSFEIEPFTQEKLTQEETRLEFVEKDLPQEKKPLEMQWPMPVDSEQAFLDKILAPKSLEASESAFEQEPLSALPSLEPSLSESPVFELKPYEKERVEEQILLKAPEPEILLKAPEPEILLLPPSLSESEPLFLETIFIQ